MQWGVNCWIGTDFQQQNKESRARVSQSYIQVLSNRDKVLELQEDERVDGEIRLQASLQLDGEHHQEELHYEELAEELEVKVREEALIFLFFILHFSHNK